MPVWKILTLFAATTLGGVISCVAAFVRGRKWQHYLIGIVAAFAFGFAFWFMAHHLGPVPFSFHSQQVLLSLVGTIGIPALVILPIAWEQSPSSRNFWLALAAAFVVWVALVILAGFGVACNLDPGCDL